MGTSLHNIMSYKERQKNRQIYKNKIEGTPILKIAMVKRLKVKKKFSEKSKFEKKFCPSFILSIILFVFWVMEFQEKMLLIFTDLYIGIQDLRALTFDLGQ